MIKGLIFDIRRFSVHDGPGIRTTIFFKGCPLSCWWCHNPESRLNEQEITTKSIKLDDKIYRFRETTGREITVKDLIREIVKDRIFFDESGGGVTLSGGEPLYQHEFLYELVAELKLLDFHVAIDTCGYAEQAIFKKILPYTDLFLFDIKLLDDTGHIKYTGVSNKVILDNLRFILEKQKQVIIRIPVIPGINDSIEKWQSLVSLLPSYPPVALLPYHSLAKSKYQRFGADNKLAGIPDMNREDLLTLKEQLGNAGFKVQIGG